MPGNALCTVFIGNLDEKVDEKVLYEILIQAGPVVDLYIPRDKETNRHKGYAFAEFETEDIAQYAIKLFSGLVCLNNRTLRFAISGQDKTSPNQNTPRSSTHQTRHMQSPPFSGKQMPPPTHAHAEMTSRHFPSLSPVSNYTAGMTSRHFPSLSPVSNYTAAYNSPGAIKNGYNLETKSPQLQLHNNNSKVEANRFDSYLSSIHHTVHRSSIHGSGYAYAYSSY